MARRGNFGSIAHRRRLSFILTSVMFILLGAPGAAQNQDPRAAAEQAIRRLGLQTELPHDPELKPLRIQLPPEAIWLMAAISSVVASSAVAWDMTSQLPAGSACHFQELSPPTFRLRTTLECQARCPTKLAGLSFRV